jgi:predicted NBD/HSP70 family sugar kinase
MKYYIGLDAHASSTTGVVVDKEGKVTLRETFSTTEGNLSHFIDRIQGERNLTFEESHLSQWLYLLLNEKVENLLVCNPVYVAKKPGAKTDFRDALHLAQELRGGTFKEFIMMKATGFNCEH